MQNTQAKKKVIFNNFYKLTFYIIEECFHIISKRKNFWIYTTSLEYRIKIRVGAKPRKETKRDGKRTLIRPSS